MNTIKNISHIPKNILAVLTDNEKKYLDTILSKLGELYWDATLDQYRFLSDWSLTMPHGCSTWTGRAETAAGALRNFLDVSHRYKRKDGYIGFEKTKKCMIHPDTGVFLMLEEEVDIY